MICVKARYSQLRLDEEDSQPLSPSKNKQQVHVGRILYSVILLLLMICAVVQELTQPGLYWEDYRLADAVAGTERRSERNKEYPERFPLSIAAQFLEKYHTNYQQQTAASNKLPDHELADLGKIANSYAVPSKNTLVVHLRIGGDITSNAVTMWEQAQQTSVANITRSRWYYHRLSFEARLISSVVIVGSNRYAYSNNNQKEQSIIYVNLVLSWFAARLPNASVTWRGNYNTPDSDFSYMCGAKHFVPSTGGYSKLVSEVVLLNNGTVYGFN